MAGLDVLIAFVVAATIFAYMPGPALLYTAAQTLSRGRRAGFLAVLGIHVGANVHVAGAALGLAALFAHVPTLYMVVKLVGAGYLIWLGIQLWRRPDTGPMSAPAAARGPRRAFFDSVTVEVLNPKTALFFVTFLPQFVDPAGALPIWLQSLILGVMANVLFSSADIVAVLLAGHVHKRVARSGGMQRVLRAAGGSVLVFLGVRLAAERS